MEPIGNALKRFHRVFKARDGRPKVIGMVHVLPLPGTPRYTQGSWRKVKSVACKEAEILAEEGVDGILMENMHDVPYLNREVGPEIVAAMTSIASSLKETVGDIPCGLQILAGCNRESIAVAKATNLEFVRCEGFVFSHIADEGFMNADAGSLLRYRKIIDAEDILIFTDVKKKHSSHAITRDLDIAEVAKAAEFFLSDSIIVTGMHTGDEADVNEVKTLKDTTNLPVVVGSGVTANNISSYIRADGVIVGSDFKEDGIWSHPLCRDRVRNFMSSVRL